MPYSYRLSSGSKESFSFFTTFGFLHINIHIQVRYKVPVNFRPPTNEQDRIKNKDLNVITTRIFMDYR
jgi:hypothetical protein